MRSMRPIHWPKAAQAGCANARRHAPCWSNRSLNEDPTVLPGYQYVRGRGRDGAIAASARLGRWQFGPRSRCFALPLAQQAHGCAALPQGEGPRAIDVVASAWKCPALPSTPESPWRYCRRSTRQHLANRAMQAPRALRAYGAGPHRRPDAGQRATPRTRVDVAHADDHPARQQQLLDECGWRAEPHEGRKSKSSPSGSTLQGPEQLARLRVVSPAAQTTAPKRRGSCSRRVPRSVSMSKWSCGPPRCTTEPWAKAQTADARWISSRPCCRSSSRCCRAGARHQNPLPGQFPGAKGPAASDLPTPPHVSSHRRSHRQGRAASPSHLGQLRHVPTHSSRSPELWIG